MKDIDYYMKLPYEFTCTKSWEDVNCWDIRCELLKVNARLFGVSKWRAIEMFCGIMRAHLQSMINTGKHIPEPVSNEEWLEYLAYLRRRSEAVCRTRTIS